MSGRNGPLDGDINLDVAFHRPVLNDQAHARQVAVAYVTGLRMRRAAELYAGSAKTDPLGARVLAYFARRHADQLD